VTLPLIAIIDDDVGIQNALRTLLRSASFRAETFASAEAFVASDVADISDCVITDFSMRGMNGIELAGLLRSRGSAAPVIVITALTNADLEQRAVRSGARCLLRKPIQSDVLIALIRESVASARGPADGASPGDDSH
jgi:FixJ family two-component response regulator